MKHYFVFHFDHGGQIKVWTEDRQLASEVKAHHYTQNSSCYFRGPFFVLGTEVRTKVDMTKLRFFDYWTEA